MAVEIIELKNLPVLTKPVDINPEDRLAISHLFNEDLRGSTTVVFRSFSDGLLYSMLLANGGRRFWGDEEPSELLGVQGDLYFKLTDTVITAVYVKYNNSWLNLQGG